MSQAICMKYYMKASTSSRAYWRLENGRAWTLYL